MRALILLGAAYASAVIVMLALNNFETRHTFAKALGGEELMEAIGLDQVTLHEVGHAMGLSKQRKY